MHTYDVPRRQPFQSIRSARPAQDPPGGPSATPIYDALYAEWVKSFRSLPGDRHGEEELGFTAFGSSPHSTDSYGSYGSYTSYGSYSSYSAGAHSARQSAAQQLHSTTGISAWQTAGRQHGTGTHHIPAALPPAPRRGD